MASAETRAGSVDIKRFHKIAHLDAFGADNLSGEGAELADRITKMALSGDPAQIKQAKILYGQKVASETNPDLSKFGQPLVFQDNVAGMVFGKFGTWSQAYRENMYRGWTNAKGFKKKAAYVARFIGIQMALHEALVAVGINDKDMSPGASALFGGGPAASTAIAAFQASGQGQQNKDALSQILRTLSPVVPAPKGSLIDIGDAPIGRHMKFNLPTIVPGSLQVHYAALFVKAIDDQDYWKAFLAATSTPALK